MEISQNDIEVVKAIKAGSRDAFAELVSRYSSYVHFVAKGLLKPAQNVVDDVTQDVFVKVWNTREKLDPNLSIKNYLYTVTSNTCKNYREKAQVYHKYISEYSDNANAVQRPNIKDQFLANKIHEAIESIPSAATKDILKMYLMEEKTYPEIMHTKRISHSAARSHISRGLAIVRGILKKYL